VGLTGAELDDEKKAFLDFFGWRSGVPAQQVALDDARTAASRRARLYRPGTTRAERLEVRQVWADKLKELAAPYLGSGLGDGRVARAQFENDLMALREHMNDRCGRFFGSFSFGGYPPGFRVAHAQKSLALLLKHYWCLGRADTPPCCPLDRRVLRAAGSSPAAARWTDIDALDDYRRKVALLEAAAHLDPRGPLGLAEWELITFNQPSDRTADLGPSLGGLETQRSEVTHAGSAESAP
jgi:hypothetical protein